MQANAKIGGAKSPPYFGNNSDADDKQIVLKFGQEPDVERERNVPTLKGTSIKTKTAESHMTSERTNLMPTDHIDFSSAKSIDKNRSRQHT